MKPQLILIFFLIVSCDYQKKVKIIEKVYSFDSIRIKFNTPKLDSSMNIFEKYINERSVLIYKKSTDSFYHSKTINFNKYDIVGEVDVFIDKINFKKDSCKIFIELFVSPLEKKHFVSSEKEDQSYIIDRYNETHLYCKYGKKILLKSRYYYLILTKYYPEGEIK